MRVTQRIVNIHRNGERGAGRRRSVQIEIRIERGRCPGRAVGADRHDDVANGISRTHLARSGVESPALHPLTGGGDQNSVLIDLKIAGPREQIAGNVGGGGDWRSQVRLANNEESVSLDGSIVDAARGLNRALAKALEYQWARHSRADLPRSRPGHIGDYVLKR